jgi:branched-subunit amino acid aminotransferase/4-amino-4-deoxychorismate lyase
VSSLSRIEVNGQRVGAEVAFSLASTFGHFTAMQVRGRRTRGLALHLRRLEAANRELFDVGLDGERVRALIRQALGDVEDASVRVYVLETDAEPTITVPIKDPSEARSPQRLRSVPYQRPDAHLKHLATSQDYYSRVARREGFDEALLTGDGGVVSEAATANIGFFEGSGVLWPDAPVLHGITMQLLESKLPALGMSSRQASIHARDIRLFDGAFLSNARGIASVSQVDDLRLPRSGGRLKALRDAYASVGWDNL